MMSGTGLHLVLCVGLFCCRQSGADDPNALSQSEALRRQVGLQRVSAIEPNQSQQSESMRDIITQLESLRWSDRDTTPSAPAVNKTKTETTAPAAKSTAVVSGADSANVPSSHALDAVKSPVDILAAADALYLARDYQRAWRFYQMMLESKSDDVTAMQWAMYQTANCLRHYDVDQARQGYDRLISEYPASPWSEAAMAQRKSLDWLNEHQAVLIEKKILSNDPNQR